MTDASEHFQIGNSETFKLFRSLNERKREEKRKVE